MVGLHGYRVAVGVGPSFSTGFHSNRPVWGSITGLGLGLTPWAMTDLVDLLGIVTELIRPLRSTRSRCAT